MDRSNNYKLGYFQQPGLEKDYHELGLLRPDQVYAISYALGLTDARRHLQRKPQKILSIGCGQGVIESFLASKGAHVTGTDIANNVENDGFHFVLGNMDDISYDDYDTVIMCESIEHIPQDEFDRNWPRIVGMLKKTKGIFIVTNWFEYHPIRVDATGWNHVREINDELYDSLASFGEVVVRNKSHLVIQF